MFIDTHCHIQEKDYPLGGEAALSRAREVGVEKFICVGTDERTSAEAVNFAQQHENVWASVGLHPHDAKQGMGAIDALQDLLATQSPFFPSQEVPKSEMQPTNFLAPGPKNVPGAKRVLRRKGERGEQYHNPPVVAIGECGLDYFYDNSPREQQFEMLHAQLELAQKYDLPVIFHVRDAFDDFWPIFEQYSGIRGVLHSFTDTRKNMEKALERSLYIGVNGISTFTKVETQKAMFAATPLERMLLETDAPFLTPTPKRGSINEPAYVKYVAEHVAKVRDISVEEVAHTTSRNAVSLFAI